MSFEIDIALYKIYDIKTLQYSDTFLYISNIQTDTPLVRIPVSKVLKTSNLAYTMLLVQGQISPKISLSMCLLAVLGSQGIVGKCTAAIFFPHSGFLDCTSLRIILE